MARIQDDDEFDQLLERVNLRRALQVDAWVRRFIHNCRNGKRVAALTTEEVTMYLPRDAKLTEKLVQQVHSETLHRGVGLTMAAVQEQVWIPQLQSLVKFVRSCCHGCKRFLAIAMAKPAPGLLPEELNHGWGSF